MYVKVNVIVYAKKEKIEKKGENRYLISVKEPAERNLANRRICEIVASIYEINPKAVRIISGYQSPSKIISINIPESLV